MTSYELTATILAVVAIVISLVSIGSALRANILSTSSIETALRDLIETGRNTVNTYSISMATLLAKKKLNCLSDVEKVELEILSDLYQSALESWLNTYEEACAKYRDKKIDKVRFKKQYCIEIRNLVKNSQFQSRFFPEATSSFKAILAVYKEWEDLENS